MSRWATGVAIVITLLAASAGAQDKSAEKVKIGLITTLSGPAAIIGQQQRNGFQLALKDLGGKLGGRNIELLVQDDEFKPDTAASKVKTLLEHDKVDFVIGPAFSDILGAIVKPVSDAGAFLISPTAGTATLAGKGCNANLFVLAYQANQSHEVMGKYAEDAGLKRLFLIARDDQIGRDSLAAFKRYYNGQIIGEVYASPDQLDYSAELSKAAAMRPDAIFAFLPGTMGLNFVTQLRQTGLGDKIKFLSAFTVDEGSLPTAEDAALGVFGSRNWAPNLDNPQSKAFVASYEKEYRAVPTTYAFQAYDAAKLIDAALKETRGDTSDKDALRSALTKANFRSLRGNFKFNINHFPIQDFYIVRVAKRPDGKYQPEIVQKMFTNLHDPDAVDCPIK
jgi:branched-chain amino acid transport system substrate-binding protein